MSVRALFQAAKVETSHSPYDTIHLKVFYPAQLTGSDREKQLGLIPADARKAPFKVVIFFNGINCGPESYQWLAVKLAERGLAVVTFSWIADNIPGFISLTPGVNMAALSPKTYGTAPTASALPTLLKAIAQLQTDSVLAGLLDLNQVVLGGHSAGGRVAIESANPLFFPQVAGAFAYGAHTAAGPQLGYSPGKILSLPDALPLLLMGGTCDGVIANSSAHYGVTWESPTTPVERTFYEAIEGGRGDSYLLLIEGANHFSIIEPFDSTTGRSFLDFPSTQPAATVRDLIAESIYRFIEACVNSPTAATTGSTPELTLYSPLIALFDQK